MDYTLSEYTYNLNGLYEFGVRLFCKNGNMYTFNLLNDTNFSGDGLYYFAEKEQIEQAINYYINSTSVTEGLMYGYCYWPYDGQPTLCLHKHECTYFGAAYTGSGDLEATAYYRDVNNNNAIGGYLGQRKGLLTNFTLDIQTGTFNPMISYDYIHNTSGSGLFFDYALSNNIDFYNAVPNGYFVVYNSAFEFSHTENVYFRFGEDDSVRAAAYANGYENGYQHGKAEGLNTGEQIGYARGYTKGLAEGGNAPVGFMSMVGGAISQFTPVLNIEVLPNITLGTCISIPVICTLLVIIFRIARG